MGRRKKELSVEAIVSKEGEPSDSSPEKKKAIAEAAVVAESDLTVEEDVAPVVPNDGVNIKALWAFVCSRVSSFLDSYPDSWRIEWPTYGRGIVGNITSRDRKTQKIYVRAPKTWLGNDDITAAEIVVYLNLNLNLPVKVDLYIPHTITRNGGAILGLVLILEQAAELVTALNEIDADDFCGVKDPEDAVLLSYKNGDDEDADETVVADAGGPETKVEDKASQEDSASTGDLSAPTDVEVEDFF